jgi:hypothetical protein
MTTHLTNGILPKVTPGDSITATGAVAGGVIQDWLRQSATGEQRAHLQVATVVGLVGWTSARIAAHGTAESFRERLAAEGSAGPDKHFTMVLLTEWDGAKYVNGGSHELALLELIEKSDLGNRDRLAAIYPTEVMAACVWNYLKGGREWLYEIANAR